MELWNKDVGLDELNNTFMVALVNSDENLNQTHKMANDMKHCMNTAEKISMYQKEAP